MKIKGSTLKQIVLEELNKLMSEGAWQPGRAVSGIGRSMLSTAAGDTPEDIAKALIASGTSS